MTAVKVFTLLFYVITSAASYSANNYWIQGNNAKLYVDLSNVNNYFLSIENVTWLTGGEANVWCDNEWHSPSDNTLSFNKYILLNGTDKNLGPYNTLQISYSINSSNKSSLCSGSLFVISFIYYSTDDIFEFKQYFPNGLQSTNIPTFMRSPAGNSIKIAMIPCTEFPVWSYSSNDYLSTHLGYTEWQGRHLNDRTNYGVGLQLFEGGNEGGPVLLFENGIKRGSSLIISTASQFMNGIFSIRTRRGGNTNELILYNKTNLENNNDIKVINAIKNEKECLNLCLNVYLWCNAFVYWSNSKQCHLKYNNRGQTEENNAMSGLLSNKTYFVGGIEGNLTFLPKQYEISFIIVANKKKGIHATMNKFGDVLKKKYETNKKEKTKEMITDYIGYWTDNGAYFYGSKPLTTSIGKELFDSFQQNNIPIRYLQLDPFWYCGGHIGDASNIKWVADAQLFPHNGLFGLYEAIGHIPLMLYSAFWSPTTADYYNEKYDLNVRFTDSIQFSGTVNNPISEPLQYNDSFTFYEFLVSLYSNISIAFEIDWMDYEYGVFSASTNGYNHHIINRSNEWIKGMNDANLKYSQSIQFCMTLPNYLLSSLMFDAVTNVRCSEDNFPTNTNRWKVAYSSLLISVLDVKPFFDVIWTTSVQKGNAYHTNSMDVELQAIIALLTNGPFGIGDDINMTNKTIINRVCRPNDGLLLHPSFSVTPIDAMYFNNSHFISTKQNGEVWFTYSNITDDITGDSNMNSFTVLSVDRMYMLSFDDLYPFPDDNDNFVVYKFNQFNNVQSDDLLIFNQSINLDISTDNKPKNNPTHLHSWNLYNIMKVQSNGWTLLGDLTCYVSVSPKRFKSLKVLPNGLSVVVMGSNNENITVSFTDNQKQIIQKNVLFNDKGDDQTISVQS